jgi:hypothetical protein
MLRLATPFPPSFRTIALKALGVGINICEPESNLANLMPV